MQNKMLSTKEVSIIITLLNYNKSTNLFYAHKYTWHKTKYCNMDLLLFLRRILIKNPKAHMITDWEWLRGFVRLH